MHSCNWIRSSELIYFLGYNADDLEAKYAKYRNVSDSNLDQLSNNMAQLNPVSYIIRYINQSLFNIILFRPLIIMLFSMP